MLLLSFFFFKQKTAYEMRISDWSSDVCSSDLACGRLSSPAQPPRDCRTTSVVSPLPLHASGCRPPDRSVCCHDRSAGHPALPKHCRGSGGLSRLTHGRPRRNGLPWAQSYYVSVPRAADQADTKSTRLDSSH